MTVPWTHDWQVLQVNKDQGTYYETVSWQSMKILNYEFPLLCVMQVVHYVQCTPTQQVPQLCVSVEQLTMLYHSSVYTQRTCPVTHTVEFSVLQRTDWDARSITIYSQLYTRTLCPFPVRFLHNCSVQTVLLNPGKVTWWVCTLVSKCVCRRGSPPLGMSHIRPADACVGARRFAGQICWYNNT